MHLSPGTSAPLLYLESGDEIYKIEWDRYYFAQRNRKLQGCPACSIQPLHMGPVYLKLMVSDTAADHTVALEGCSEVGVP